MFTFIFLYFIIFSKRDNIMFIKELRVKNNILQKQIAHELGIKQNTYSQYENGVIAMNPEMLVKTADYFNVSVDYLLGRTQNKKLYK